MPIAKSLPKLIVFGDPKKQGVTEAIEELAKFVKDKAKIIASDLWHGHPGRVLSSRA